MQSLLALYRAQQKKQWEFLANTTLDHAQRHNSNMQKYEKQLLENQVQIQQLKLDGQRRQQEATRLYLILAAVAAISLGALAWVLWRSRRRFSPGYGPSRYRRRLPRSTICSSVARMWSTRETG